MSGGARISYERIVLDRLRAGMDGMPGVELSHGQGIANRFPITEWNLPVAQHFQFGDLRIEGRAVTVVVEVESAGGTGNLVKYWPMLAPGRQEKRFMLIHLFRIGSDGDYASHRQLWEFLVARMREDLERRGVRWGDDWEARLFTYRKVEDVDPVVSVVREVLG